MNNKRGTPNGIFDSGPFRAGKSWTHTFTKPGTYPYFCTIHPWMEGVVAVQGGQAQNFPNYPVDVSGKPISKFPVYAFTRVDEDENVIVQYGHDKSSLIDILGYSMSITAKLTSLTNPNKITIDEDVYDILHPEIKSKFTEIKHDIEKWKYLDKHTGRIYKLYTLHD